MSDKLRTLDLFAGIGGFAHGLEMTGGFEAAAFCEIEPYARAVLRKHWPEAPIYDDVRSLSADRLAADGIDIDVITGGFPCQDISLAGKGAGLDGDRSILWFEYKRLIAEIRPRYAIIENVSALRSRGLDVVLRGLAALGYDAEWHCIPAAAVGAPHRRDRVWIVAYPGGEQHEGGGAAQWRPGAAGLPEAALADADGVAGYQGRTSDASGESRGRNADRGGFRQVTLADADGERLSFPGLAGEARSQDGCPGAATDGARWWSTEPDVGRVADGVPSRVDRLRALGNAVVPQIPRLLGEAILIREFLS